MVLRRKDLGAPGFGPLVERTMGTKVVAPSAVRRLPQVGRLIGILGPPGLLRLEPSPRQIAIQQTRHNGVHDQRGGRARARPNTHADSDDPRRTRPRERRPQVGRSAAPAARARAAGTAPTRTAECSPPAAAPSSPGHCCDHATARSAATHGNLAVRVLRRNTRSAAEFRGTPASSRLARWSPRRARASCAAPPWWRTPRRDRSPR